MAACSWYGPTRCVGRTAWTSVLPSAIAAWSQRDRSWSSSRTMLAVRADPCVPPCVVEQHQRQQPGRLRLIGEQRDHGPCQPDRLGTQLAPDQGIARRRRVALVEDQVEDLEDAVEALGEQVARRHAIRDAGIVDLALGPDEPLGERRLGDEEGPSDLRGREAAQRAERQRDATVHRQRRMAAGEDQPQSVVACRRQPSQRRRLRARSRQGPPRWRSRARARRSCPGAAGGGAIDRSPDCARSS